MHKFLLSIFIILTSSLFVFAQNTIKLNEVKLDAITQDEQVRLPITQTPEYGQEIFPQSIFLRFPPNSRSKDLQLGISVYIGKYLTELDPDTNMNLFESYGSRGLIDLAGSQLQSHLLDAVDSGKITQTEALLTLDMVIKTEKELLRVIQELTKVLIKSEYPFQPSLTAIPKPK